MQNIMNIKDFKLNIVGTFDGSVTENELTAQGTFFKTAWPEICRVLETHGVKNITTASLDAGGKNITLPAKVGAGV